MKIKPHFLLLILIVLMQTALLFAQNVWDDSKTKKRALLSNTLDLSNDIRQKLLQSNLRWEQLSGSEFPLQWIESGDPFHKFDEQQIRDLIEKRAFLRSNHILKSGQPQRTSDEMQETWVTHYASGLAPGMDVPTAMVVDGSGNVYVTGYSSSLPFTMDYLTAKYNSSGAVIWTARYNGDGNDDDYLASAIAIDSSGNVYVTGGSVGQETGGNYVTVKYNSSGIEQWAARYNGPGDSWDYAKAIAVDDSGNVYVTGESYDSETDYDYATIKYNSAGIEQWVDRYNGPGNSKDYANAIAVDVSGNVYITGESYGLETYDDYATIKYNSAGVEQWVARYNGSGNFSDYARDIVVDVSGNFYVTGESYDSETDFDYATVKYNSAGAEQWVARYNGPGNSGDYARAISVDVSGNVYVTGASYGSSTYSDYATIKYNSAGAEQWVAHYNGSGNSFDYARDIVVDVSGNVYVTGESYGSSGKYYDYATVKYNSAGVEQWVARHNGPGNSSDYAEAIAVDVTGNVYVTGESYGSGTTFDYATIKYNSAGAEQWVARYNGPGNSLDYARAIAVDVTGKVYVTGESYGSGIHFDYATVKYNSAGVEQWVARYNGSGNTQDCANAITVDDSGNVYVTGYCYNLYTSYDYATIKYNSAGVEQWVACYNGPGNSVDYAWAIAVDVSGNVYVTGYSRGTNTERDYATVKYDSAGVEQWVARYNGPGNSVDYAKAIAVDVSGNVYVTGYSRGSNTEDDYATVKYNSAGVEQWVARYNGPGNNDDYAEAIAVDVFGNVYVTGVTGDSYGSETDDDYATIKYNSAGFEQWVARYNGTANYRDNARAIAIDDLGNIYVTGESYGRGTGYDYSTIKYNNAGVEQWVARYNGTGNCSDYAKAIAVDESGNIYVTGQSGSDFATIKYNSFGTEQWVESYNGPGYKESAAAALDIDAIGNVYVTGYTKSIAPEKITDIWSVYTTIKYEQQGDYLAPQISHTAITTANSGESQTVSATLTDNVGIQSAILYYRKGGASSFTSTAMNKASGDNWEGTIPASFITERGTEYYISGSDISGNTATYPESDPQNSPQVIQINFSNLVFTASTPAMAYQMISVPAHLDSTSPASVLEDDLGNYDDTQWRLLQYTNGTYNEYPNVSNFDPGKGFWLITRSAKSLDTGAGKSVTTAQNYQITLQPGWNQIGNPFAFTVNWSDVIKDGNAESQLVGYSGSAIDESGYDFTRTQLVSFEGYFVKNQSTSATTIQIPPKSATGTSSIAKHATGIPGIENLQGNEWMVRIKAKSGRYVDKDNYIGVLNSASDQWDSNDFSEAPFFEDLVSLYFPHLDWQSYPGLYTGDFRSVTSEGHYWDFNVKSNSSDSEVTLNLTQVQNLPPRWEILLLDRNTHTSLNFLDLEKYTYIPGEDEIERKFRIVVGQAEFIDANDLDLAGIPQDFFLSQNYPNPFNSETRLNYELPQVSDVNIAIFNLNGQLVKTLFAGPRSAGRYAVSWDGTTQAGSCAVSGVYLVRMKAENFMAVRKVLLVD